MIHSFTDDSQATLEHASLGSGKTPAAFISDGGAFDGDNGHLLHVAPLDSVNIQNAFLASNTSDGEGGYLLHVAPLAVQTYRRPLSPRTATTGILG
jgi:hypothetical protein